MKKILFWIPAVFCALISYTALYIGIDNTRSWQIIFLAFLPLCFFVVGDTLRKMNKEILQLRLQIGELQKKSE
jgi:FtsH-binding integral membrane protein